MNNPAAPSDTPERPWMTVIRGWNHFWFQPADPTVLGLVRICAGLVILYMHIAYTFDLLGSVGPDGWVSLKTINEIRTDAPTAARSADSWMEVAPHPNPPYSDAEIDYMLRWEGWHPSQAHARGFSSWSLWYQVTNPTWIWIIHGLILLIFFLFTIGFCTRITSVLAWLANLSYIQRNYVPGLFGVDAISNLALLYLMIGPSGAALSVDRLIERYWRTWRALRARASSRKSVPPDPAFFKPGDGLEIQPPQPLVSANVALRLLQVHVCIVYLASGLSKLQGTSWWNATALWGTMANADMSPVNYPLYVAFIQYLCDHRWLWELFMAGGALFTLFFEISFAYLIWNRRLRWIMIASAVMLHTGIAFFMGLTTFSLMMLSVVMSFAPPETVHWLVDRLARGRDRFQLVFAAKERGQVRAASLIHAFDVAEQVRLATPHRHSDTQEAETPGHQSLHLITEDGTILTGYPLFERVVRSLRLLWPVALFTWIPGVSSLARARFPEGRAQAAMPAKDEWKSKSEKVIQ